MVDQIDPVVIFQITTANEYFRNKLITFTVVMVSVIRNT